MATRFMEPQDRHDGTRSPTSTHPSQLRTQEDSENERSFGAVSSADSSDFESRLGELKEAKLSKFKRKTATINRAHTFGLSEPSNTNSRHSKAADSSSNLQDPSPFDFYPRNPDAVLRNVYKISLTFS